jgi:ABC-type multidrug transport system ATPase subunit
VSVKGRVGALIEVGAGFHPDLTGRENVYLNGAILGLSRREITKKFDRIVEFANLEAFIDTPVKRYSSGMYMRLGFAVAAHTDPDILLIDEVLAVGDALFQNKCLKYLKQFVANGGSVLFVSHSMSQVAELCGTCVWLDYGEMRFHGPTKDAIAQYMTVVQEREDEEFRRLYPAEWEAREQERREAEEAARRAEQEAWQKEQERITSRRADASDPRASCILGVLLRDADGMIQDRFRAGEPLSIQIAYRFGEALPDPVFGVDIFRNDGLHMFTTSNYDHQVSLKGLPREGVVTLGVPIVSLNEGRYRIQVNLFAESQSAHWFDHPLDELSDAATFEVYAGRFANGCCYLPTEWKLPETAPAEEVGVS